MFWQKRCTKCDKKIKEKFEFCPFCGIKISTAKDYGLLGKSDKVEELNSLFNPQKIMGSSMFEKMISSAFKMVEKEMQKVNQEELNSKAIQKPKLNSNFELYINGKKVNMPGNIAGVQFEETADNSAKKQIFSKKISDDILKKASKLPRKEAKTQVQRMSDKLIYELTTPGLKSMNNILINKLEDTIEIRAYTPHTVFFKILPIKLPLTKYSLKDEKLLLEFNLE